MSAESPAPLPDNPGQAELPASTPAITPMSPPMSGTGDTSQLEARVAALEARFPTSSWVYSSNFFKRALALWGNVILIQLIIAIVIWAIIFACAILFGLSFAGLRGR